MTKFKTAHGNNPRQPFATVGPSMTHQSMAPECDINTIMRRYEKTGILEHRNNFEGQYADFTETPTDYHESMNAVIAADEMFGALPARIRQRFHNDPASFIDFVGNPDNREELVRLGLATRREGPEVPSKRTTPPEKAKAPSGGSPSASEGQSDED
jgi:phage internal scaffolding protein